MYTPEMLEAMRRMNGTHCLICGEHTKYKEGERGPKVCDKCKTAVLEMRKRMEAEHEQTD